MAPRVDSPTNLESAAMAEEDDIIEEGSLSSRPLRRVPTPMGQSHTTGNPREGEESLFDKAENASSPKSVPSQGSCFGAELESLNKLKNKAGVAANRGRVTLHEMIYGVDSSAGTSSKSGVKGSAKSGNSPALSLFDAITKPFAACTANFPKKLDDAVGELVANAVPLATSPSDDLSKNYSYDEEYDEARQLRRMTSWNTLETANTAASTLTEGTEGTDGTDAPQPLYDDDGNLIPNILVDLTKGMRQKRTRKKRVVKFDYPPISSLKECPRPDPNDLPNLYFTEDELNQIEDDRHSTTVADDVEVVCVSSSESTDSPSPPPYESRPLREMAELDESDTSSLLHQNEQASQQKQRRYRGWNGASGSNSKKLFNRPTQIRPGHLPPRSPMTPSRTATNNNNNASSSSSSLTENPADDGSTFSGNSQSAESHATNQTPKRLIKSVHIFMRERSRERSAEI